MNYILLRPVNSRKKVEAICGPSQHSLWYRKKTWTLIIIFSFSQDFQPFPYFCLAKWMRFNSRGINLNRLSEVLNYKLKIITNSFKLQEPCPKYLEIIDYIFYRELRPQHSKNEEWSSHPNLMVKLPFWRTLECGVYFHSHSSLIQSDREW